MFKYICFVFTALLLISSSAHGKYFDDIIVVKKISKSIKDGNTIIKKSVSFKARTVKFKKDVFQLVEISSFSLFPNPASDYIEIALGSRFDNHPDYKIGMVESDEIAIYDVLGERVLTVETRHALSLQKIDISHLPRGVYFVRIGDRVEKFVKR